MLNHNLNTALVTVIRERIIETVAIVFWLLVKNGSKRCPRLIGQKITARLIFVVMHAVLLALNIFWN